MFKLISIIAGVVARFIGWLVPADDTAVKVEMTITNKENKNMNTLKEGQSAVISGRPVTRRGNTAAYQKGSASWELSDETVAQLIENPENELEAKIEALDGSDDTVVNVTLRLDGDPDEGQDRALVGSAQILITQGEAFGFDLAVGAAQDEEGNPVEEEVPANPTEIPSGSDDTDTSGGQGEAPVNENPTEAGGDNSQAGEDGEAGESNSGTSETTSGADASSDEQVTDSSQPDEASLPTETPAPVGEQSGQPSETTDGQASEEATTSETNTSSQQSESSETVVSDSPSNDEFR